MISTSSIRISCVIRAEDAERAMGAIVRRFGLEGETLAEEA
jgi:aspartokinase